MVDESLTNFLKGTIIDNYNFVIAVVLFLNGMEKSGIGTMI